MLRLGGIVLGAALLAASPVAAQDEKPIEFNIGGGFTGVYGAASDRIGNAGMFAAGLIFHVNPVFAVQTEYGWNGFKQKQLQLDVFPQPLQEGGVPTDFFADGNMQYLDFNGMFTPHTSGKVKPYGVAGIGYYHRPVQISTPGVGFVTVCDPFWYVCFPDLVSVDQVVGSRSSNDFGMNFGGGVNFRMAEHASIYFEVRYHYIWGPEVSIPSAVQPLPGATSAPTKADGIFVPFTVGFRF